MKTLDEELKKTIQDMLEVLEDYQEQMTPLERLKMLAISQKEAAVSLKGR